MPQLPFKQSAVVTELTKQRVMKWPIKAEAYIKGGSHHRPMIGEALGYHPDEAKSSEWSSKHGIGLLKRRARTKRPSIAKAEYTPKSWKQIHGDESVNRNHSRIAAENSTMNIETLGAMLPKAFELYLKREHQRVETTHCSKPNCRSPLGPRTMPNGVRARMCTTVSYTHLTLPTSDLV